MPHKFDPRDLERLDSEARRQSVDIEAILSSLPLEPWQSVADIGCGTGFFSLPLSRSLPQGKVYALDIADEMLEKVRQKVQESGISNIEVVKSGEMDFPVPGGALDGVFLSFVLHEQEDRIEFLRRVRDLLKPSGWLSVIEWQKKEMKMGPPLAERIDHAGLSDAATRAGFRIVFVTELGEANYMALLRRQDAQPAREA